jgi:hypothetical protein
VKETKTLEELRISKALGQTLKKFDHFDQTLDRKAAKGMSTARKELKLSTVGSSEKWYDFASVSTGRVGK